MSGDQPDGSPVAFASPLVSEASMKSHSKGSNFDDPLILECGAAVKVKMQESPTIIPSGTVTNGTEDGARLRPSSSGSTSSPANFYEEYVNVVMGPTFRFFEETGLNGEELVGDVGFPNTLGWSKEDCEGLISSDNGVETVQKRRPVLKLSEEFKQKTISRDILRFCQASGGDPDATLNVLKTHCLWCANEFDRYGFNRDTIEKALRPGCWRFLGRTSKDTLFGGDDVPGDSGFESLSSSDPSTSENAKGNGNNNATNGTDNNDAVKMQSAGSSGIAPLHTPAGTPALWVNTELWQPQEYSVREYEQLLVYMVEQASRQLTMCNVLKVHNPNGNSGPGSSSPSGSSSSSSSTITPNSAPATPMSIEAPIGVNPSSTEFVSKALVIFDCSGYQLWHAKYIGHIKALISIAQDHYPERIQRILIVHAPFIFRAAWAVLGPLIRERTRKKIFFVRPNLTSVSIMTRHFDFPASTPSVKLKVNSKEDIYHELSHIFKDEDIPEVYGGTRKHCPVPNALGVDNYYSSIAAATPDDLDISDCSMKGKAFRNNLDCHGDGKNGQNKADKLKDDVKELGQNIAAGAKDAAKDISNWFKSSFGSPSPKKAADSSASSSTSAGDSGVGDAAGGNNNNNWGNY